MDFNELTPARGGFLDLPFFFLLDTTLLLNTIPTTIANHASGDDVEEAEGTKSMDGIEAWE